MRGSRGVTVTELLIAVAIAVVLCAVGIPPLLRALPLYRLNGAARLLAADFRLARTLAAARGADVLIRFDFPSPNDYTVAYDTDPAPPDNDHLITDKDERIKTVALSSLGSGVELARYGPEPGGKGPSGVTLPEDGVSFTNGTAQFGPDGHAKAGGVYVRTAAGSGAWNERCVTVTGASARARIYARRGSAWE